jgi:hypothetical protein
VKAQHTVIEGLNKIRDAEPDPYKDLLEEKNALKTQVSQKITQQRDMHAEFRVSYAFNNSGSNDSSSTSSSSSPLLSR